MVFGHGALDPAARLAQIVGRIEQAIQFGIVESAADLGTVAQHTAQVAALGHGLLAALLDQFVGFLATDALRQSRAVSIHQSTVDSLFQRN